MKRHVTPAVFIFNSWNEDKTAPHFKFIAKALGQRCGKLLIRT
jgi:hypothetical protein